MASITIVTEAGEESYPLGAAAVVLGRGLESDVRLKDIKASRRHCQIVRTPQGFQIVDLSSGNGTFVNGVQVRQQVLSAGDKIQIGSTTLTFVEGPTPKPAPRPPAAAESGPSPAAATARVAAAPVVGRSAPVKGSSSGSSSSTSNPAASRSAAPSSPRPSTQAVGKPASSSVRKSGVNRPAGGPRTGARKPDAPASKKIPTVLILEIAGGVLLLGAASYFFLFSGGRDAEKLEALVHKLEGEAGAARKSGRFDAAKSRYQSLIAAIEGNEKFKKKSVEAKLAIEKLDALATADKRFAALKARAEKPRDGEAAELLREVKELYEECAADGFPWLKELREMNDRLEKSADPTAGAKRLDFASVRQEIQERCKLSSAAPQYAQAVGEWQAFAADKKVPDDARQKAHAEVASLNAKAKEEAARLRSRAEAMARENKKAEAIDEVKNQRPRFKDTAAAEELEAIIRDLER